MRGREQRPGFDRLSSFKYSRVTVLIARWTTRVTLQADRLLVPSRRFRAGFIGRLLKIYVAGDVSLNGRVNRNVLCVERALLYARCAFYVASSRSFDSLLLSNTRDGSRYFDAAFSYGRRFHSSICYI